MLFAVAVAGCGGSDHSSPSTFPNGLWVPNFFGDSVTAFSPKASRQSGIPSASVNNENPAILQPQEVLFDKKGNLWITNCVDSGMGAGSIAEYTHGQVSRFSHDPSPDPNVIIFDDGSFNGIHCPYGEAFDKNDNLWVSNRFGPNLVQFTRDQLKVGGAPIPNTEIDSGSFFDPEGIQFDESGTLWMADVGGSQILGFKSETLAAVAGSVAFLTPDIVNSSASILGPTDVLVEKSGNQWVANCDGNDLLEFAAADVAASGSPTPITVISATTVSTPTGSASSLDCPQGLVFDQGGNLWVSNARSDNSGSIVEFTKAQIAASGNPSPKVFLDSDLAASNINEPALLSFGPNVK
jgi:DNA-binding beta-propeller fold protein YncE